MRNLEIKNNESGRSMIEMLGVLAIIGVLSVGGIAGYSKAIHRYRVNKTIEQITYMSGSIRSFFAPQKSYKELNSTSNAGRNLIKKAKLIPDEMWETGKSYPQHIWGSYVEIKAWGSKSFEIVYHNIPEEVCIDLISQDWIGSDVAFISTLNAQHPESSLANRDLYVKPPVDIDKAVRICTCAKNDADQVDYIDFMFDANANSDFWKSRIDAVTTLLNN